ncbi:MAG TPA: hypothetical protein HPQ04_02885 [Rhodospirillaceae bacterium]|nr:hypothetical protein [Rhodospirillaceae bacterium]
MWWLRTFLVLVAAASTAACGFHPLYGRDSYDADIQGQLASVRVLPLPDRQGQLLHNALLTNLSPRGETSQPKYTLRIVLQLTESQQALRKDDTATRNIMYYNIAYYLYEGETAITAGTFVHSFSYDFLLEHYANIAAQEDIKKRAAGSIADEIRTRLAAYFAKASEVKAGR